MDGWNRPGSPRSHNLSPLRVQPTGSLVDPSRAPPSPRRHPRQIRSCSIRSTPSWARSTRTCCRRNRRRRTPRRRWSRRSRTALGERAPIKFRSKDDGYGSTTHACCAPADAIHPSIHPRYGKHDYQGRLRFGELPHRRGAVRQGHQGPANRRRLARQPLGRPPEPQHGPCALYDRYALPRHHHAQKCNSFPLAQKSAHRSTRPWRTPTRQSRWTGAIPRPTTGRARRTASAGSTRRRWRRSRRGWSSSRPIRRLRTWRPRPRRRPRRCVCVRKA